MSGHVLENHGIFKSQQNLLFMVRISAERKMITDSFLRFQTISTMICKVAAADKVFCTGENVISYVWGLGKTNVNFKPNSHMPTATIWP